MNYGTIKKHDIANGEGVRTSLFVSGCRIHCKECFNSETWDFGYGKPLTEAVIKDILDSIEPYYISGLSILGGEPMEPENQEGLMPLILGFSERYPDKSLWLYSGYRLDKELAVGGRKHTSYTQDILERVTVLVDGPFVAAKKNIKIRFRGSENQRLIDMKKTRESGSIIPYTPE